MTIENKKIEGGNEMQVFKKLQALLKNDLLVLRDEPFKFGPEYRPVGLTMEKLDNAPLSLIIGETPSAKAVSPLMWNAELKLRGENGYFLPADAEAPNLSKILDTALAAGKEHFRVLTITNPYKIEALKHFLQSRDANPEKIRITSDAERIGATNQVLIGPDNVFNVINSDGQGMANAVESFLSQRSQGSLAGKSVGIVGAGGAGRGIIYEIAKRVSLNGAKGAVTIFNRTVEKGYKLAEEYSEYFPDAKISGRPLSDLKEMARQHDLLVSSITEGDPLLDEGAYQTLPEGMLIIDANYAANSKLALDAATVGRHDLDIHDGAGMVVEGFIIPSKELGKLWGYEVPAEVYQKIGKLFNYKPKE
jgi:shikimate 5-dehydrogenase